MPRPFLWLASYPKSGNTWLRIFLGAYLNGGPVNINALPWPVCQSDLKTACYQGVCRKALSELSQHEVRALRGAALIDLATIGGQWPILTKTHHVAWTIDGVELIPPLMTEKAVYVVRDPRDVAVSMAHHMAKPVPEVIDLMADPRGLLNKERACDWPLHHVLSTWSLHVDSWMRVGFPCLVIRYEDLRRKPATVFRRLLKHIGWPVETPRLRAAVKATRFSSLRAQEAAGGFREGKAGPFFRSGRVGAWRDELSPAQVRRIEADHGEVMRAMGYL